MGQNMGQKCGLKMGHPKPLTFQPFSDFHPIQDPFEFLFPGFALTGFSRGFDLSFFEPPAGTGIFSFSAGNLPPNSNMGQKHGSGCFSAPGAESISHAKVS